MCHALYQMNSSACTLFYFSQALCEHNYFTQLIFVCLYATKQTNKSAYKDNDESVCYIQLEQQHNLMDLYK